MNKACVDANVILRFLLNDPLPMAQEAATLFQAVANGQLILLVDDLIVAEMVWVLKSFYKQDVVTIATTLRDFLLQDGIETADKPTVLHALTLFETKNVDFVDALLAARMMNKGMATVFSFDRHFDRLPLIQQITPGDVASFVAS
ncbi:MAG: PIN domain-containing protein [Chloroflexi bacterium]|nr:PIN domain-containing protein [Ardenticatenaceae bacterium]MBL1131458.1 type II toxin-antitoxin system VapC family toxin [Chloroflexota bacterium]NOG37568.1 PIN domain-containing protein [Chloroflexota bacterium]GIK56202.1 MAG: hypothetical protein BroJett015_18650 [Chloroflexota bacterium]